MSAVGIEKDLYREGFERFALSQDYTLSLHDALPIYRKSVV